MSFHPWAINILLHWWYMYFRLLISFASTGWKLHHQIIFQHYCRNICGPVSFFVYTWIYSILLLFQVQFSITEDTTLANLLALNLHNVEDDVRNIVDKAVKELGIEKVNPISFQILSKILFWISSWILEFFNSYF